MVKITEEFIRKFLDDLDEIHTRRFKHPKSSVDWKKFMDKYTFSFESFLFVENGKKTVESLKDNFPEHYKAMKDSDQNDVELSEDDIREILDEICRVADDIGLHKRRVVDGDDVHSIIKLVENKTGVNKKDYNYYPEKEK